MVKTTLNSSSGNPSTALSINPAADFADNEFRQPLWRRLSVGIAFLSIGVAAVGIGLSSIFYNATTLTVGGGVINGRLVELKAPVDGEIADYFPKQGVAVEAGQLLVRIIPDLTAVQTVSDSFSRSPIVLPEFQGQERIVQLQGQIQATSAELAAANQTRSFLQQQLRLLEGQDRALQTVNVSVASDEVATYQAELDGARAQEESARIEYERYNQLYQEGAVSALQIDQLRADWREAQAGVDEAEAELASARTSLRATQNRIPISGSGTLQEQRRSLTKQIQEQGVEVSTLSAKLQTLQRQLSQFQGIENERETARERAQRQEQQETSRPEVQPSTGLNTEVKAPFAGVIYNTVADAGEQVSRPETLVTLLDCSDIWVETIVGAEEATRIDVSKPVRVRIAGQTETLDGEVELVKAVSRAELARDQAQAIIPAIPADLDARPIARVVVRIPAIDQQAESYQLCGVGQLTRVTFATTSSSPFSFR
ncbi:MAG: HlyD family efflux transporter periplasmic adaptor subunit [Leptolyngbyaceae cyanobacterium SL_7_1]|nr:HlyD family efflux transporter periplasmic adaptor subunit [Leptolyngbyaceae cyanobacterium SL_7_1]